MTTAREFKTKDEMVAAYATTHYGDASPTGLASARIQAKYVPHLYRGGYFIVGFGYSTERIDSGFVSRDGCGMPEAAVLL